jgi:hypothetical protein
MSFHFKVEINKKPYLIWSLVLSIITVFAATVLPSRPVEAAILGLGSLIGLIATLSMLRNVPLLEFYPDRVVINRRFFLGGFRSIQTERIAQITFSARRGNLVTFRMLVAKTSDATSKGDFSSIETSAFVKNPIEEINAFLKNLKTN